MIEFTETTKLKNQSMEVFIKEKTWPQKETISNEMVGYAEIESKKPKSFATSNCVLVNAGNLLLRLSSLQSSF